MPDTHCVAVNVLANLRGDPDVVEQLKRFVKFAFTGRVQAVHRDVFTYAIQAVPDKVGVLVVTMMFYRHTPMICLTLPRSDYDDTRPLV